MDLPEFFVNMLKLQYEKKLTDTIVDGFSKKRAVTFRINTIKSSEEEIIDVLNKKNIEYERVKWSKDAFIARNVNESDLEKLDIYNEGKIYLQSLSSMLPPIVLNPQENFDILDMAAAPGGKTTQMAALTKNKSHITACEMNSIRAERLKYNVEKQGASCVYVMTTDSRRIDDFFSFDQILLDAPCSGSGTLNIDDENLEKRFTEKLVSKSVKSQETLLRKAIKILKSGKEMVYSTCSILSCENEDIVNKILKETNSEIIPIDFDGIEDLPILPTKIKGTLCVCPTELYEGFFVAKIKKK